MYALFLKELFTNLLLQWVQSVHWFQPKQMAHASLVPTLSLSHASPSPTFDFALWAPG